MKMNKKFDIDMEAEKKEEMIREQNEVRFELMRKYDENFVED